MARGQETYLTSLPGNYFLKSELPTLFAQQRNLFTPTRFIEDDGQSTL